MDINKMILSVLKTKAVDIENDNLSKRKREHLNAIRELGLDVIDREDSSQGYVTVINKETNQSLVISKNRSGDVWLYGNSVWGVEANSRNFTELSKVFDYYGFLKSEPRERYPNWVVYPEQSRIIKYNQKKNSIEGLKSIIKRHKQKAKEAQEIVDEYEKRLELLQKEINEILKRD